MDVNAVLKKLIAGGIQLKVIEDKLKIKGNLTNEDKAMVKQFKEEIIAKITREQNNLQAKPGQVDDLLAKKGYVRIYSNVLGEVVLWVANDQIAKQMNDNNNLVIYTLEELNILTGDKTLTVEGLKRIHEAKKMFGGKIVDWGENKSRQKKSPFQGL